MLKFKFVQKILAEISKNYIIGKCNYCKFNDEFQCNSNKQGPCYEGEQWEMKEGSKSEN